MHDHTSEPTAAPAPGEAPEQDPIAEARRLLAEDEQARMQACHDELTAVLDKYGMNLTVTPARAVLVPKER